MPRKMNPRDIEVGRRIRARRMQLGLSQTALGNQLDITFQQVQKYEKGTNRVGAGRLQEIAQFLQVPVGFFFDPVAGVSAANQKIFGFLDTAHSLRLVHAFSRIRDKRVQHSIVKLVENIADNKEA
jgi:transcriptional regulator with XRE-family HTH domain